MSVPFGLDVTIMLGIVAFLAFSYLFVIFIANVRIVHISAREIALLVLFMMSLSALVSFVLAGHRLDAFFVLILAAILGAFLFVTRLRRWLLDKGDARDAKREAKRTQGEILRLR